MNLAELFTGKVATVMPTTTLAAAARKMAAEKVGAVIVVVGKKVTGILTDRDIALAVAANGVDAGSPVTSVMTKDVVTIWEDQGILNATQYFRDRQVRRLPIVNRDDELVGIVTLDDLIALLGREIMNVSKAVVPALADKK